MNSVIRNIDANIRRFTDGLGLLFGFTELDVNNGLGYEDGADFARDMRGNWASYDPRHSPEENFLSVQGDFYRRIVQLCIANRRAKMIIFWGTDDRSSWLNMWGPNYSATLFDQDANPKPAYFKIGSLFQ